jgi:thioesterase domain-containing protein/acyl carrier protein
LLTSLGRLWLAGVRVDWPAFTAHEDRRRIPLPTYPFERRRYWIERSPAERRQATSETSDRLPALAPPASASANGEPLSRPSRASPRDETERRLVEIWQQVLGAPDIDVHSDFFALGGHSLLAIRMFALCERSFGRRLPLSTLVHAPTVGQLADLLRRDTMPRWSCLVALQPNGSRPPFFCMHAEHGDVLFYRDLAQLLGPDQPVCALQAQGLDGTLEPWTSIEAMATHYLEEMRSVQPAGPYYLGGFCLGAVIAFEMARQLQGGGQSVGLLAALDASGPRCNKSAGEYMSFAVQGLLRDPLGLIRYLISTRLRPKLRPAADPAVETATSPAVVWANCRAFEQYEPQPYRGRVTWFVNGDRAALARPQWREYADEVERWVFPGSHATMFQSPAIDVLASQLRACLIQAQAGAAPDMERTRGMTEPSRKIAMPVAGADME